MISFLALFIYQSVPAGLVEWPFVHDDPRANIDTGL